MGTAGVQGELWSARARNWATLQDLFIRPAYEVVFYEANIGSGTQLLDVGCGAGLAAQLAAERGAHVSGIDLAASLIEIAHERVPEGDFRVGGIEELPYPDGTFDVITGFNSFQYAGNLDTALREARRVVTAGGRVAMVTWGMPQDCEHATTLKAIGALLPPPPPGAGGPFALSAGMGRISNGGSRAHSGR